MAARFWFYQFPKSQLLTTIPPLTTSFTSQTVIITGANTGLGLEAARHLVNLDCGKVILAVRSVSKGETAVEKILVGVKDPEAARKRIEVWELDLGSSASLLAFGERVKGLERLDAVIQNAGMLTSEWRRIDGMESHVQVNLIGAVMLGLLVLPKLRESARKTGLRGRLSFVGSDIMYVAKFQEDGKRDTILGSLNDKEVANMSDRYGTSKLLLLLLVREMARLSPVCPESNVIINYMTPGACYSDIFRDDLGVVIRAIMSVMQALMARSTETGGRTLVHAVDPNLGPEYHGRYIMDTVPLDEGERVKSDYGKDLQRRITKEVFEKLESIQPGITKIEV